MGPNMFPESHEMGVGGLNWWAGRPTPSSVETLFGADSRAAASCNTCNVILLGLI